MKRARLVAVAGCAVLAVSCLADPNPPTIWPPDDFEIRIAGMQPQRGGDWIWQRFMITSDGLAFYREAGRAVDGTTLELPVFDRAALYLLRPESMRSLSRLLHRAGVFEHEDVGQEVNRREADPHVIVRWTAFGRTGELSSFVDSGGVLDRVVHVVNSFLPEGVAFDYPELSGEIEPPRLSRVPEPLAWIEGAKLCHAKLVELEPEDPDLPVDLFTLAFASGDVATARSMVEKIEQRGPVDRDLLEFVDWEQECLAPLKSLLAQLGGE